MITKIKFLLFTILPFILFFGCKTSEKNINETKISSIQNNVITNDYFIQGEEGTPCKPRQGAANVWESNDCASGFACVNLRGRTATCHRMCEKIGDI